jgi:hypothetical protein
MTVVELRQYTLHPGMRDALISLFEREFVTGQEAAGIRVGARFRDLDDPNRFVWLRWFPDMDVRPAALSAFYDGPVWRRFRDRANATMIDSDDVLLLRGEPFAAPNTACVTATLCHPRDPDGFARDFEERIRPALTAAGAAPFAVLRTEHAPNNYPRLPVRAGEDVLVWFTAEENPYAAAWADAWAGELVRAPQVLRLSPVRQ